MLTYDEVLTKGVYFLLRDDPGAFYHLSICLAEGLQAIGIPVYSNINYWRVDPASPTYLFNRSAAIAPDDCAICAIDLYGHNAIHSRALLAEVLDTTATKVILNNSDFELWLPEFELAEHVLRTHMLSSMEYPSNYVPWAFGISDRIQRSTAAALPFRERQPSVLVNFRESINQGVRIAMELALIPHLAQQFRIDRTVDSPDDKPAAAHAHDFHLLNWSQAPNCHHPHYYERLKTAIACCAYGGNFVYWNQKPCVIRWDSWRFWESLAAGCVTISLDFEQYGLALPIAPQNWTHYIGIDLAQPQAAIDRIAADPNLLSRIAEQGRQWAIEHYSPKATACYFLDLVFGEDWGTTRTLLNFLNEIPVEPV